MSSSPTISDAGRPGGATLKLREFVGHRWWGFVLASDFFLSPLGAFALARIRFNDSPYLRFAFWLVLLVVIFTLIWFILFIWKRGSRTRLFWGGTLAGTVLLASAVAFYLWQRSAPPQLSPLLWYLGLSFVSTATLFWLFVKEYARSAYWLKTGDDVLEVSEEQWRAINWLTRANALWHGIIRLEFFGWVIWVTSAAAAIAGAINKALDQGAAFSDLNVIGKYFHMLDLAAFDLIRSTVIGTIVLFFVQLLKTYQEAIVAASKAAKNAEEASVRASEAILEARHVLPNLNAQMKKTLDLFKIAGNLTNTDILTTRLAQQLSRIAGSDTALDQLNEFSDRLYAHLGQINQEITRSYETGEHADHFDLVSLSAIYTPYLRVESASFEEADGQSARGGIRLSTRYPHYALAVRSLVEAVHRLAPHRFKFYTLFNREPELFFNPETFDTPPAIFSWTALFLERFCRWHHKQNIPYTRIFVTLQPRGGSPRGVPPLHAVVDEQLDSYHILCILKDGKRKPCLLGEHVWELIEGESDAANRAVWSFLSEDEARELKKSLRGVLPPPEAREKLKGMNLLGNSQRASYLIVSDDRLPNLKTVIEDLGDVIGFMPLKDVLLDYHSQATPPEKLVFDSYEHYEKFFGSSVPRDLLAIWDKEKGGWALCLGTMVAEKDPTAIVMVVTSKDRPLKELPWEVLEGKLSGLFCKDPANVNDECRNLRREPV